MNHHQEELQIVMLTLVIKNIKNEPSSGGTPDSYMLTPVIKNIKNEPS